jgi:hypothetical protein
MKSQILWPLATRKFIVDIVIVFEKSTFVFSGILPYAACIYAQVIGVNSPCLIAFLLILAQGLAL